MYHSNGNYEAFSRPKKPEYVDQKSAYLIGSGIASLASAAFLLRDAQMKGENIHIFEESDISGGALDGYYDTGLGFVIRGGRELENHYECLWDLYRSVPSLEIEDASVLDEFYWLNKEDPNFSLERAIVNRGESANTGNTFTLDQDALTEMGKLYAISEDKLADVKISDVFSKSFFESNFWLYWRTMFAFEPWHSAMEMRRYLKRFIHDIDGMPDFSILKFTKYNQYESFVLPLMSYLKNNGVHFQYNTSVSNVIFGTEGTNRMAKKLVYTENGQAKELDLTENDLVFITNGSNVESSTLGDNNTVPAFNPNLGSSWTLWKNVAQQYPDFGIPEKFCGDPEKSFWESATITLLDDKIVPYIEKICKRDPYSGRVVTGGIVTVRDSSWLLSFTLNRQPHFKKQPKDELVVWFYTLNCDTPGDYIKKSVRDCTGSEITQEWLYHMGVPIEQIQELAEKSVNCIPCVMPYVTAYFMPRAAGDRPKVIPDNCINAAFVGNFAETERDTVFTTEYSVRTAMEAVYTLLNVDRGVPEVFASAYDVRMLLLATSKLMDGKKITDIKLPFLQERALKAALHRISDTELMDMLKQYGLV